MKEPRNINRRLFATLRFKALFVFILFLLSDPAILHAEFDFSALADFRLIATSEDHRWLEGGYGKTRYGVDDPSDGRQTIFRVPQAALMLRASYLDVLAARLHVNVDAEPAYPFQGSRLDLIEAFIGYRPVHTETRQLRFRGGIFFPPVSLENTGPAWTSPHTLTYSAINSWIGEEVRTVGLESSWSIGGAENTLTFTGALFGYNDPAGTLLAWRGWAMHDRLTGFRERLALPRLGIFDDGQPFQNQPAWVEPLREVDGRAGYYAGAALRNERYGEVRFLLYNNRGNPVEFDGKQYAWYTEFVSVSGRLEYSAMTLISQWMSGTTEMGPPGALQNEFLSYFALGSIAAGNHRVSVRYDKFEVTDIDTLQSLDNNNEDGYAWTAAYGMKLHEHATAMLEWLRIDSTRPARTLFHLPAKSVETQIQANLRVEF